MNNLFSKLILYCFAIILNIKAFAQSPRENGYKLDPRIKFGADSAIAYSFIGDFNFIDFYKDGTFLCGSCLNDTFCNCLCIKGTWKQITFRSEVKRSFFEKLRGKPKYSPDSVLIQLSESKRVDELLYRHGFGVFNNLKKSFNDTFVFYYNPKDTNEITYAFRREFYTYITPIPRFKNTIKVPPNVFPEGKYGPEVYYLESKYNIKFDYKTNKRKRLKPSVRYAIIMDWYRARRTYKYCGYYRDKICSCYDSF